MSQQGSEFSVNPCDGVIILIVMIFLTADFQSEFIQLLTKPFFDYLEKWMKFLIVDIKALTMISVDAHSF